MAIFICLMIVILIVVFTSVGGRLMLLRIQSQLFGKRSDYIFDNYIDGEKFYLYLFGSVPNRSYIYGIEMGKALEYINENYADLVLDTYQSCYFNKEENKQEFNKTVLVFSNKVIVEIADHCVQVMFSRKDYGLADRILKALMEYRIPEKTEDYEINIISYSQNSLGLKRLDIKPVSLDLDLNYNEDFKAVDELIRKRLNQENDKGIVLLHGLPGTGKTTYLRHLIGAVKKKVLFVAPSAAANLMNPEFVDLLIDNPNCILVIEDAENIILDRNFNRNSSVSNLLNLSDGLLSDCLSVQVICTFNSAINLVDSALMRKGRLIARYEFGKLSVERSQKLSTQLGFNTQILQPMTIAEIANQHEEEAKPKVEVIGFRRAEVQMN